MPETFPMGVQRWIMAAIVATLLIAPAGALLALACTLVFDVTVRQLVTFGGSLNEPEGVLAWWVVFLLPSWVYARIVLEA